MEPNDLAESLELKGVKPTANRILVLKALKEQACPVSLTDLEDILATMDKSSIFRVLTLFLEHDIVHSFEDGRGILNYELCTSKQAKRFAICPTLIYISTASHAENHSAWMIFHFQHLNSDKDLPCIPYHLL